MKPAALVAAALPADAIQAARSICEAYEGGIQRGGGIPAIAVRMGLAAGTLYNKLSGDDEAHHKLTVRDMVLIWLATSRIEHLQALGRTMNCACFQVPDLAHVSDAALLDLLATVQVKAGEFHGHLRAALADGEIDRGEYRELERDVFDWIGAIVEANARLKGLVRG